MPSPHIQASPTQAQQATGRGTTTRRSLHKLAFKSRNPLIEARARCLDFPQRFSQQFAFITYILYFCVLSTKPTARGDAHPHIFASVWLVTLSGSMSHSKYETDKTVHLVVGRRSVTKSYIVW